MDDDKHSRYCCSASGPKLPGSQSLGEDCGQGREAIKRKKHAGRQPGVLRFRMTAIVGDYFLAFLSAASAFA